MIQTMLGINIVYNKICTFFFSDDLFWMFSDLFSKISGKFGQKKSGDLGKILRSYILPKYS